MLTVLFIQKLVRLTVSYGHDLEVTERNCNRHYLQLFCNINSYENRDLKLVISNRNKAVFLLASRA